MNGPTAVKVLREYGCQTRIIGLTGNVLQDDVDLFLTNGADAVVPKPLTIMRFIECIADLTNNRQLELTDP
jgi:CheY-like chemotaxis protein